MSVVILGLSSCEDVIQVETDPAESLIVIDGWITTQNSDQTIILSQSQPYFDSALPPPLTGASVIVESSNSGANNTYNFVETAPGEYVWQAGADSLGETGTSYELIINVNGKELRSTSIANRVPVIDSIGQEFEEESLGTVEGVYTQFYARDPIGFGDTYWIRTFKNGEYLSKSTELNIAYDAGFDAGGQVDGLIYIPPIRDAINPVADDVEGAEDLPPWATGDEIRVEIHSISNDAFFFLETARDQINNGDSGLFAIPLANTLGNVIDQATGDPVLGVFNVAVVSSIVDVIE